ncbi:MAG: DUF6069 family protein [Micromonosporaceae bacterium]
MSTTTTAAALSPAMSTGTTRRPVWRAGLAAAAAASVATTVLAAIASEAGVTFADPTGVSIPLAGFAQLTFIFSMIGVALAGVLARRAQRPRRTFVRTTVVLTVLSCVPDVTLGFDTPSAITLMLLHVVAAAIVVPTLASRLPARQ